MRVADDLYTFLSHKIMELTQSFPPADALIQQLSKIEYKKHLNTAITIILTIAAVVYVLGQMFVQWYQNGGKDSTIQTIKKVWNFLAVCYTWICDKGIPALNDFMNQIIKIYQDWKGLVIV